MRVNNVKNSDSSKVKYDRYNHNSDNNNCHFFRCDSILSFSSTSSTPSTSLFLPLLLVFLIHVMHQFMEVKKTRLSKMKLL